MCVSVCVATSVCRASGNKSTEIKTGNHFVGPFQLPKPRKKYKGCSAVFKHGLEKPDLLYSKSKSIAANSLRLILALIQHGTRAQVIKMNSPLLLAPNSPLQIVFLLSFSCRFLLISPFPHRCASTCLLTHVKRLVPRGLPARRCAAMIPKASGETGAV